MKEWRYLVFLVKYHLMEHGETIISENAVEILAENFM